LSALTAMPPMGWLTRMRSRDLVAHLCGDGFNFDWSKATEFHVGALCPDRLGPCPRVRDDEVLGAVQIGDAFLPVIGVALKFQAGAADVLLELKGPGTHGMRFVPVDVLIEILFGVD